jgi:hypothetical protein
MATQTMFNEAARSVARGHDGLPPDARVRGVAGHVLLTKADLLRESGVLDPDFFLPAPVAGWSLGELRAEVDDRSTTVRRLLSDNGGRNLVGGVMVSFPGARFHAVSATGHPLDPATGQFPRIDPFGCLEPFLLSLERLGIIGDHEVREDLETAEGYLGDH